MDNQPQVRLRFRFESDGLGGTADGWHLDDVVLQGGGPACMPPGALVPRFDSNSPVLLGRQAYFTDTSLSNPPVEAWQWDFGDGGTATISNPTHLYAAAGTYSVTLVVRNSLNTASVTHTFVVLPCDALQELDFSYTPASPLVGEAVAFTGSATGTLPIAYSWAFGDGGAAAGITATHAYTAAGTYTVTLTAENCAGMATVAHAVTVAAPCANVEALSVTQEVAACTVTFTAALSGTAPFTYLWAFGDGITSTQSVPVHTYAATGTYSGTLDVWNCDGGGHDSLPFAVQVECAAPPEWTVYLPVVFK
jgi:PKD repeat protein